MRPICSVEADFLILYEHFYKWLVPGPSTSHPALRSQASTLLVLMGILYIYLRFEFGTCAG